MMTMGSRLSFLLYHRFVFSFLFHGHLSSVLVHTLALAADIGGDEIDESVYTYTPLEHAAYVGVGVAGHNTMLSGD